MSVELKYDEASLEAAVSGAVWGSVWLQVGDEAFPAEQWSDLVVAVAVELVLAADGVLRGVDRTGFSFFDGPYGVKFSRDPNADSITLSSDDGLVFSCGVEEFRVSVERIKSTCRSLIADCVVRGWSSQADVRRLRSLVDGTDTENGGG